MARLLSGSGTISGLAHSVNAADIGSGVLPVGVTGGSGLTALGTVTTGTLNGLIIFNGITPAGVKWVDAHATTCTHNFTVSNNSKYMLFFTMNPKNFATQHFNAVAQATVDGSGAVTPAMVVNDFNANLTVTSGSSNVLTWTNTNLSYSTSSILIQVGGA